MWYTYSVADSVPPKTVRSSCYNINWVTVIAEIISLPRSHSHLFVEWWWPLGPM